MKKWSVRLSLVIIALMPIAALAIAWWIDKKVSSGAVVSAVACSLAQLVLLLYIQFGADETDRIARETQKEVSDAASVDYAARFNDRLK